MSYPHKIDFRKLLLAFSRALDLTSSGIMTHHMMVTIASMEMARALGLNENARDNLFYSATIHDIGVSSSREKTSLMEIEYNSPNHAIVGRERLILSPVLEPYSETVRHHHDRWDGKTPSGLKGEEIPLNSRIIHLADRLAVMIERDRFVIGQEKGIVEHIERLSGSFFQPMLVDCLKGLVSKESLLLDMTSDFLPRLLDEIAPNRSVEIDVEGFGSIAGVFAGVIDQKSPYTRRHSQNVTTVAMRLAERAGFSLKEVGMMKIAGLLHDLGKLTVPDEVLDKKGRLTPEEFNIMRGHTYFTYHILRMIDGFETISEWAAFHHEKLSGAGYPFHLKGDNISLGSRIMAVSDVFSALTEDRPYRKGLTNEEIIAEMEIMVNNDALDRKVVDLLKEGIEEMRELVNKEV